MSDIKLLRMGADGEVERTPYVGDWGADLITRKDGVKTVIQAKRYKKPVGVKAIREAVAAKGKYGCAEAMVVTNSTYTRQSEELTRANGVALWDRNRLIEALLSVKKDVPVPNPVAPTSETVTVGGSSTVASSTQPMERLPDDHALTAPASAPERAVCFVCNTPVSAKVEQFCRSNAQRFGGKVYCFDHQKQVR